MAPGSIQLADGRIITVANNIKSGYACDAMVDPITGKVFVSASRLGAPLSTYAGFAGGQYRNLDDFTPENACTKLIASSYNGISGYNLGQYWSHNLSPRIGWNKNNQVASYLVGAGEQVNKIFISFSGSFLPGYYGSGLILDVTGDITGTISLPYNLTTKYLETACSFTTGQTITVNLSIQGNEVCQWSNAETLTGDGITKYLWGIFNPFGMTGGMTSVRLRIEGIS